MLTMTHMTHADATWFQLRTFPHFRMQSSLTPFRSNQEKQINDSTDSTPNPDLKARMYTEHPPRMFPAYFHGRKI